MCIVFSAFTFEWEKACEFSDSISIEQKANRCAFEEVFIMLCRHFHLIMIFVAFAYLCCEKHNFHFSIWRLMLMNSLQLKFFENKQLNCEFACRLRLRWPNSQLTNGFMPRIWKIASLISLSTSSKFIYIPTLMFFEWSNLVNYTYILNIK